MLPNTLESSFRARSLLANPFKSFISERLAGKRINALHLAENNLRCLLIEHLDEAVPAPLEHCDLKVNDKIILFGTLGDLRKISKYL
ncbi:hypothetical protein [Nitrosospira briensis]|uniref:hypothetical protein n=1 Tax=Nitrosospira briensis TaxID=35799 RepID=UPI0008F3688B|nr:hypothetical protein [Nitrosospira briensis]SFO25548.1 hypothetical protein SAMN05216332_1098 [Nitrosospira briensis]